MFSKKDKSLEGWGLGPMLIGVGVGEWEGERKKQFSTGIENKNKTEKRERA